MPSARPQDLSGLLNINKPGGETSRDVVNRVVRLLPGAKVGHAGTLDPLASGVLVVCVGAATRLVEYVQRMPKTYRTTIRLGARSDTLDADGRIAVTDHAVMPREEAIRKALGQQVGTIAQIPPQYSALKVNGRRAYELARGGQTVDLAPRTVTVHRVELLSYEWPHLVLEVECGGGTFIRSIARDVGESLGCGGLVEVLTRTRIGPFGLTEAIDPQALSASAVPHMLRPPTEALAGMPTLRLRPEGIAAVAHGRAIPLDQTTGEVVPDGEVALLGADGGLCAIGQVDRLLQRICPVRVFAQPPG